MENEILLVAEAVSGEKGLPQEAIFEAIEQALATATKKRYSENSNIEVIIDPKTGDYETFRLWEVVSEEELEDEGTQVPLRSDTGELGSFIREKVENIEFGRIAAQAAKQVIVQKVRDAERLEIIKRFRPSLGQLVSGSVKKVTREYIIVDLGVSTTYVFDCHSSTVTGYSSEIRTSCCRGRAKIAECILCLEVNISQA